METLSRNEADSLLIRRRGDVPGCRVEGVLVGKWAISIHFSANDFK
jgi:hypothetical protein